VIEGFHVLIQDHDLAFDVIAGIETAGIPHSAALAYTMSMPSVFIRKQAKNHGLKNRIEGGDVDGARALLIEDLVSTGGSSLSGIEALREASATVDHCLAIVSYGFAEAIEGFAAAQITLHTLTDFQTIAEVGVENGLFGHDEMDTILDWLADPHGWADRSGFGV
jgi:orotate phosphoribosyltransferase